METWKLINGTSWYEISDRGRVRRIAHYKTCTKKTGTIYRIFCKEMFMKVSPDSDGYMVIGLFYDKLGKFKYPSVHRLVAEHFLSDWDPNLQVNHLDGDKSNNNVTNLEMATCKENIEHFWTHPSMENRRKIKLIRNSQSSREVMSRPDVKIRESEKQGKHVLCIEDNRAFSSRSVCAKFYGVSYDLIYSRCEHGRSNRALSLKDKSFKYLTEEEYQIFKQKFPERVVIYV